MKSFVIKKMEEELELSSFNFEIKGFNYKIKNDKKMDVKEIVILNPEIINSLIYNNFNKKYKKIVELYLNALQDEDDSAEGKLMIALDEIARLRSILIRKYNYYLNKKTEEKQLKKLKLLENEIRSKIIDFKLIKEMEMVNNNIEEKSKSR